jgi:hypothetical protein
LAIRDQNVSAQFNITDRDVLMNEKDKSKNSWISTRVVDPYSFFTDPDPDPELDVGGQYGSRALMTKN